MRYVAWAFVLGMCTGSVWAQERAVGGPLDDQMTWTALVNRINTVSGKVDVMDTRVGSMEKKMSSLEKTVKELETELSLSKKCGNKGLVYGPSHASADANGCVPTILPVSMYLHARERLYQPTGIYVKKGQTLTITASGMASAGYEHPYYTADERLAYGSKSNYCMLRFAINPSKSFHADVYDYSGSAFCGKSRLTIKASASGYLYAGVPEAKSSSGDNQGGFMISVTVK